MRKFLIGAAAAAVLAAAPTAASAQASTAAGVAVGAGTGFAIGGPPGAVIGGVIGGGIGAAAEPRGQTVYVEPRAEVSTRVYSNSPRCWRDEWGRRYCEYR